MSTSTRELHAPKSGTQIIRTKTKCKRDTLTLTVCGELVQAPTLSTRRGLSSVSVEGARYDELLRYHAFSKSSRARLTESHRSPCCVFIIDSEMLCWTLFPASQRCSTHACSWFSIGSEICPSEQPHRAPMDLACTYCARAF